MAGRIAYYGNVVTDGLILDLDAAKKESYPGTGSIWRDISQNNFTGSFINGPTYNSNTFGSIVFDGVDDSCIIPGQIFNVTNDSSFTIEIYFKRNSSTPTTAKSLYSMGSGTATNARIYFFFDNNSNGSMVINYFTNPGLDAYVLLSTQLLDTNFHQAVQVINKSTLQMTGYFDGINKGSTAISSSPTSDTVFRLAGPSYCNTSISIVRIYNRALTSTEVTQNFNAYRTRYGI